MIIVRNVFVKWALTLGLLGGLLARPVLAQTAGGEPKRYELGGITVSGASGASYNLAARQVNIFNSPAQRGPAAVDR